MAAATDKRKHPRWDVDKEIFCYVDGDRLDARSGNISLGGMFLCTDRAESIPMDSLVGLVFRSSEVEQHTTFLFGKVVRKQEFPDEGVGLMWEKAVTVGPPEMLVTFLKRLFSIERPTIIEETAGPKAKNKSIFKFESLEREIPLGAPSPEPSAETAEPVARPPTPSGRFQKGLTITSGEIDQLDVRVVKVEHTPVPSVMGTVPGYVQQGSQCPTPTGNRVPSPG